MGYWLFVCLVLVALVLSVVVPRYRLRKALEAPFPASWSAIIERNSGIYNKLPEPLKKQLRAMVKQFLHQKHFSGAGGLEITDEIRVTIAAEACVLLLNRHNGVYPALRYIIVYPASFVVSGPQMYDDGTVGEARVELAGESWSNGKVILAWDEVLRGSRDVRDGRNVVLHEFAHQLDAENGSSDGAPVLGPGGCLRTWAEVLSAEFAELQQDAWRGRESLLDHYGASDPAEFFAVATETFFEKPRHMARHHAELFDVLRRFYRVDPRTWAG